MTVRRIIRKQPVNKAKLAAARHMRREPTPAENQLWQLVRSGKLGVKFRRQQIIDGFIADFYCHAAALVIEVDGLMHAEPEQAAYDAERDRIFAEKSLTVLRFSNSDIFENKVAVVDQIRNHCKK